MAKEIELTLNDAGTELVDPGTVDRGNVFGRKVTWKIKDKRIDKFRIEGKDPGGYYPFSEQPSNEFGKKVDLEVRPLARPGEWEYKIIWIHKTTHQQHTLDPKIAVNPIAPFTEAILFIAAAMSGLFCYLFYRNRKAKNH